MVPNMWCLVAVVLVVVLLLFTWSVKSGEKFGRGAPLGDFLLTEGDMPWDVPTGEGGYVYEDALP